MRILNIIFGILSFIVAGICFAHPFSSQIMYGYIIAIFIGAMGIVSIVNYFISRRQLKELQAAGIQVVSSSAGLIIGILGVVFMLLNMTIPFFAYSVQEFAAIVVAMFMLTEGIACMVGAITNPAEASMGMRILMGVLGVLMVIGCAYAIMFPPIIISMFGIFLGIGMAIQGAGRIVLAFSI